MRRIATILPDAPMAPGLIPEDHVHLDHDMRHRRRMVFTTARGKAILLDMHAAVSLRDGDGLVLEDGEVVRVEAAAEALIEITAPDLAALVRIAWHLGNRHLPTQLLGAALRIRHDHVIADMVVGLGGTCNEISAAFDPEGGAYAPRDGKPAAHSHHHHDHAHAHAHAHGHSHG
jgi:urease accessory protein